jgi:hypothetical protein
MAVLKFESQGTTPNTPDAGWIRIWSSGTTIKYITSDGTIRTLSTGVTPEEVEDIVGSLVQSSNLEVVYDDAGNALTVDLPAMGTSGNYTHPEVTVDEYGRITSISNGAGIVRGDNFQKFKDTATSQTTSLSAQLAYSFTTTFKEAGEYRFGVSQKIEPNSTSNGYIVEWFVDGQFLDFASMREEGKDTSNAQEHLKSGHDYLTLTAGVHNIECYFNTESGGTLVMKGCAVEMWRV